MISKVATSQKTVKQNQISKEQNSNTFSFLTDFNASLINSKTNFLDFSLQLKSRITTKGKIKFCNTDFCDATKTNPKQIQNTKLTNLFHPEMPKVILEYVSNNLETGVDAFAIIKHIDNNGKTIWLNSHFSPNQSNNFNIAFTINANPTSQETIKKIEHIYNTIFLLENHVSYEIAKKYFEGLLEMEYGNYEGFMINAFQ